MILDELLEGTRMQKADSLTLWLVVAFGIALMLAAIACKDMSMLARLSAGLFGAVCLFIAIVGLIVAPHT